MAGEAVALRLSAIGGLEPRGGRLGSCFGPWEHASGLRDTLSPHWQILWAALRDETAVLAADVARDWLYVRDAVSGLLTFARHAGPVAPDLHDDRLFIAKIAG
jgi:UDP-glucuronate 4-epimerase